jgi:hypothetical protein
MRHLPQGAHLPGLHQGLKQVRILNRSQLQLAQRILRSSRIPRLQALDVLDLRHLFLFGRTDDFLRDDCRRTFAAQEGVDADDRELAGVLLRFVVKAFLLDFAALVHRFHGAQNAAALGDAVEFGQHGFLHQVGQFFDDEAPCSGFSFFASPVRG